jgi:hypothetical protein
LHAEGHDPKLIQTYTNDSSWLNPDRQLTQIYEVDASQEAVAAYYHDKLIALGWQPAKPVVPAGPPLPNYQYVRDKREISLLFVSNASAPQLTRYEYHIVEHTN